MPRTARQKSKTGIYHVMLRGINQQRIFEDDEDNEKLLKVLDDCKMVSEFELYGYCLMGNHVHFLIKTIKEDLDQIFKRIGARYVYWYNWKYRRTGHLFQDRFKSESVENERYFLTVLRYIHQNPIKAGLCSAANEYKWSSYNEYVKKRRIVDIAPAMSMMGLDEFVKFNNSENSDYCLEDTPAFRLTDGDAREIMRKLCNCGTVEEFQKIDFQDRSVNLKRLKDVGISIRQINRLTGVSKGIVERA